MIADDDDTAIAAVTVAELQVGASLAGGSRRTARQAFIDAVVAVVPVISYDLSVAIAHTRLLVATRKAGRPRGAHDLIIAATAVAGGRVVVTADPTGLRTCLASRFATTADTTGTGRRPTGVADGPGYIERLIDAIYDEMGWA